MTDPILRTMLVMEAVSSVALSHEPGCDCVTCRAAAGDPRALLKVFDGLDRLREEAPHV